MADQKNKHISFLGTYFDPSAIFRISTGANILAWIVLGIYISDWLIAVGVTFLQIIRGFWVGWGITDYMQNIVLLLERPLRGLVYFIVLQGVAKILLLFLDIEDNTRRATRYLSQKPK